jgi:type I restriction enzyme S subunit
MVPREWVFTTVGEACTIKNNLRLPINSNDRSDRKGEYPYFGPTGILGYIDEYRIDEGFALIGEDGDHFLKFREKEMTLLYAGKANVNNHAHIICTSPKCTTEWFHFSFVHRDITAHLTRQGAKRYKLTKAGLERLPILIPPVSEQIKIARILSTWDKAIKTVEKLIANSQQQKEALMHQLLTGKVRFPGFKEKWTYKTINQVCQRIQRKTDGGEHPILTISSLSGFVRQDEKYSRYMAGKSVENYIQLEKGDFAYNKGNSKTYEFGCVFDLESYQSALVPHVYVCFKIQEGYSHRYFKYLFEADYLKPQLGRLVNTGVRNNGLLNIQPFQFLNTKVPVPSYEEQERVADILAVATKQMRGFQKQLNRLQDEKRALMQSLLTGKRRVKVSTKETSHA